MGSAACRAQRPRACRRRGVPLGNALSSTHPTARLPGRCADCYESALMQERSRQQANPTRRDILRVATGVAGAAAVIGAVGPAAFMVPQLDAPEAAMPAVSGAVDVDLAPL